MQCLAGPRRRVVNTSKSTVLADKAEIANSFVKRLVGLLNRKSLGQGEALILSPSNSIHSFFMHFTFDAVFVDKNNKVIAIKPSFIQIFLEQVF